MFQPIDSVNKAAFATVGSLFHSISAAHPQRIALCDGDRKMSYELLEERSNRLANFFISEGLQPGDRIAVLANNCAEYFELEIAAAKAGLILAALNWRLTDVELAHCVNLAEPKFIVVAAEMNDAIQRLNLAVPVLTIGNAYEQALVTSDTAYPDQLVDPESGFIILYTSGTTGLPKGALISHRAMVARGILYHALFNVPEKDNFIAWTPMYHMVSTDHGLATLMRGGTVWVIDGYQPEKLITLIETQLITWFVMVPGMVGDFVAVLKERQVKPKGIKVIGAMADLVPKEDIAEATALLNAPFLNTFGATETGLAPASGAVIPIGVVPDSLAKTQTPFCDIRLVDTEGRPVAVNTPGEVSIAGPTLFSGYWNNNKVNVEDFRNNRFHMGDVLRRNEDGSLDYVDRVKYLIKSGGENIYPAEIESVISKDERIETVVVVRKTDKKWGEVPVAFVVSKAEELTSEDVRSLCKQTLPSYKMPKDIIFIEDAELPRSTTGKIQRHLLEEKLV